MIHILNSAGVPSAARIIRIPGAGGGGGASPPSQVTGLTVTTASDTQLNLSWTANPTGDNVTSYNVYRGTTAGFSVTPGTTTPIATPTTNSYSNTGLTASTTYYYKVAAVNSGGIGPLSAEASGTTAAAAPDTTPPTVAITQPATGSQHAPGNVLVTGTASDNAGGSGVRDVRVRIDSGTYVLATPGSPGNWSTWSISLSITAVGSHTITARVRDIANNFSSAVINITITSTPTSPPSQVTGLTVTTASNTQLNLSWTANPPGDNVTSYNVYRGTTAGFPVTPGTTTPIATPTTNSYSNTGLTASTTYYYKVAAVNSGGIGPLSAEASGTTAAAAPDTTPPIVAITQPATGSQHAPGTVLVTGTASDNAGGSGVRDVRVKVDSGAYLAATPGSPGNWSTWSISLSITAAGSHTITARVRDIANNFSSAVINITIT
jgi:fibronectin type 3 domain-containing protein